MKKLDAPLPDDDTDDNNPISMDDFANALKTVTSYNPPEPYRAENNAPPVAEQNRKWKMVKRAVVTLLLVGSVAVMEIQPARAFVNDYDDEYASAVLDIDDDGNRRRDKKRMRRPFRIGVSKIGSDDRIACKGCVNIPEICDMCLSSKSELVNKAVQKAVKMAMNDEIIDLDF